MVLLICSPGRAPQAPNPGTKLFCFHLSVQSLGTFPITSASYTPCSVSTPNLSSLCTTSLPGSPLNLPLQAEPFITNQLFELHFPQFQQQHHDMGCFLKTNLKKKENTTK